MRYIFALASSVLFLGSAQFLGPTQGAPFISPGAMPNPLIEPVQGRGYYSYDGAHCYFPYVSVGDRCVYGGGYSGGYYGGYRGGYYGGGRGYYSYDGAHCYFPYVSVGTRCVRAY